MLGDITQCEQLQFNETMRTLIQMTELSIEMSPLYHYGALNAELQLIESILKSTRCRNEHCTAIQIQLKFH